MNSMPASAGPAQVWTALGAVYLLWGSTYLGIAIVVGDMPPLLSAGTRFAAAGLLLAVLVGLFRGWDRLRLNRRQLGGTVLVGFLLLGCGNGGVSLAERYVPSGLAALIVASVPLWIVVLRRATGEPTSLLTWLGVLAGLAGVIGLIVTTGGSDPDPGPGYVDIPGWEVALWLAVIAAGSFCWAVGSFLSPRFGAAGRLAADPLAGAAWQMVVAGGSLTIAGLIRGEALIDLARSDAHTIWVWVLLVFGGLIAYACFVWLLQHASVSLVSTYAYVNPVVAVVLGWLLLSEPISGALLIVGVLVVAGVVLVIRGERQTGNQTGQSSALPVPERNSAAT